MISFAGSYWCQGFCRCRNPSPGTGQGWSRPELSESLHVKGNAAKALAQPSVLSHTGVSRLTSHGGKCHHHANCPCHTASHRGGLYCSCRSDLKPLKTLREVRPSLQNHGGSSPVQGPGGPRRDLSGSRLSGRGHCLEPTAGTHWHFLVAFSGSGATRWVTRGPRPWPKP